jgi:hypothetical protein
MQSRRCNHNAICRRVFPRTWLTFSAMTPNAVKRRKFRTKPDEVDIFLQISEIS